MSDRADNRRFVAMLFGRNIFGSGRVRQAELHSCLAALSQGVRVVTTVGTSGNLILDGGTSINLDALRERIDAKTGCSSVVVEISRLRAIWQAALEAITVLALTLKRSPRGRCLATYDGASWEPGLVFSSAAIGSSAHVHSSILWQDAVSVGLQAVDEYAVLVLKRPTTSSGTRIPWGDRVLAPARKVFSIVAEHSVTSRSLGSVERIMAAA